MQTLRHTITYDAGYPIRIVVFSDVHIGSVSYSEKHFKGFLSSNMNQPNTYLIGLGDHLECIVPADTKRYQISQNDIDPDDPDAVVDYQSDSLVKILQPYADKLIGLAKGNHELAIIKRYGHNPHRRVCESLNCTNLGYSFLLRLRLRPANEHPHVSTVIIYGHHGWGGASRTAGGNVTKYSRALESYWADIYLFGHSHDTFVRYIPRIEVDAVGKPKARPAVVCNTGTFKKTLSDGPMPTWSESKGFPPKSLGGLVIQIMPSNLKRPTIQVL